MTEVRLAELVAALSLGVDLGFGQPMEHVLRQCMIALRLADRIGLEDDRALDRLLHRAARERGLPRRRARAGEVVRRRHRAEVDQVRPRASGACARPPATMQPRRQRQPAAAPFPGRARVRRLRPSRPRRDDRPARGRRATALAERLGLPPAVQESVGASYEQWDGKGWPGDLAGDDIPIAARLAQFAEFIEVAHRLGGVDAAVELAERRSGLAVRPGAARGVARRSRRRSSTGLDSAHTWSAVIDAEPALARHARRRRSSTARCSPSPTSSTSSRRTRSGTRGRSPSSQPRPADAARRCRTTRSRLLRRAGLVHDLGRLGRLERDLGQAGPARRRASGSACGCTPI